MSRKILSIVPEEKAHHDSSRKRAWVSLHLGLPPTVILPSCYCIRRNAIAPPSRLHRAAIAPPLLRSLFASVHIFLPDTYSTYRVAAR